MLQGSVYCSAIDCRIKGVTVSAVRWHLVFPVRPVGHSVFPKKPPCKVQLGYPGWWNHVWVTGVCSIVQAQIHPGQNPSVKMVSLIRQPHFWWATYWNPTIIFACFALKVPVTTPQSLTPVKSLLEKLEQEHGGRLPGQLSRLPHNSMNDSNQ